MQHSEIVALIYTELLKVAGGATVVIAAFSGLLGKIWIDRIARREATIRDEKLAELKADLDRTTAQLQARLNVNVQRSVNVDKVQFEHEYATYRSVWECLFQLQIATLSLRPIMDRHDATETEEQRVQRRISEFVTPFNAYSKMVEANKPFYPQAVYEALVAVRDKCRSEVIDYEHSDRRTAEYWKGAMSSHKEILELIESACTTIRARISEVRVT
jgi:hypothetical protein